MGSPKTWLYVALGAVPLLVLGMLFSLLIFGLSAGGASCGGGASGGSSVTIDPATVPNTTIAGYGHEQLVNAAYVITAGKDLGLGVRDQTIGVMTAMGESSLRVIDYGDAAGPDSRGLFQQRANGAWGSYSDRMDPYISSTNFFKKLMTIKDRDSLEPTIVAHRVQINADPYHYTKFWAGAVKVVEGLTGVKTGLDPGTGSNCSTLPGTVSASGWAKPGAGPITSSFGYRVDPFTGARKFHSGTDLAGGGCDGPIWAAQAGVVVRTGFDSGGNGTITIDHGGGVKTSYLHEYASGILVHEGDHVKAGDQIGRVGSSGRSTGCHLHFMVIVNGSPIDAVPFMHAVGVDLG